MMMVTSYEIGISLEMAFWSRERRDVDTIFEAIVPG